MYKKYLDEMESNKKLYNVLDIKYEELIIDSSKVLKEVPTGFQTNNLFSLQPQGQQ